MIDKSVNGSGKGGRITVGDLRQAVAALGTVPDHYEVDFSTPELDAELASELRVMLLEGDTSDGAGSVMLVVDGEGY